MRGILRDNDTDYGSSFDEDVVHDCYINYQKKMEKEQLEEAKEYYQNDGIQEMVDFLKEEEEDINKEHIESLTKELKVPIYESDE